MAAVWILDLIWWWVGHAVARLVLPLVSFGKVRVEPLESPSDGFGWAGCRRIETGRLEVELTLAAGIGMVIYCIALAAVLYLVH
ncbi:hypothetical protein [Bradyrhizobium lablabi]|uniref:hypothetical protein n=1 Tax=Bradyrhizobium lablabi TaxID=722472 RepID=UPI001BA872D9|nr:hypothetical protein [Bradyrhizobium lablabi]MBR0694812.1 hypothetical protein [Bradyrhizobium lablabi]